MQPTVVPRGERQLQFGEYSSTVYRPRPVGTDPIQGGACPPTGKLILPEFFVFVNENVCLDVISFALKERRKPDAGVCYRQVSRAL